MNTNVYKNQKDRALSRKKELVKLMGGRCCMCGYNKNYSALEFHHINPQDKEFQLDSRHLSNTSMESIIKESEKCILVCSNCHKEIHHPSMDVDIVDNLQIDKRKLFESNRKQSTCRICGKTFDAVKGKIYCSKECRYKDRGYNTIPTREEVVEKYNELKSQRKVAEYFGLTKKIIMNILKKEK